MCGIAGISGPGATREVAEAMTATLGHRGPDGRGLLERGQTFLGHTRLSIIDLETGDQPISNEDNSVTVVCNGEIYNFRDLREELEKVEAELSAQFDQDPIDESKASQAIDNAVKARSDLTRAYSQMSLRLREVLTTYQWQELQRRQNSMRDRGRSGGRRGRGGDDRRKTPDHGTKPNPPV